MKRVYTEPTLFIEEVMVESGIAQSVQSSTIDNWIVDEDSLDF